MRQLARGQRARGRRGAARRALAARAATRPQRGTQRRPARLHPAAVIAFTDDDTRSHPNWTADRWRSSSSASRGRRRDRPRAAGRARHRSGALLPVRHGRLRQPRTCRCASTGASSPPTLALGPQVWRIGAGANMAFRRAVFDRVGGFDERLGAGAAGCSEDSELWYRILAGGGVCLYEPRAVVDHHHRADWRALRTQMRAYMRGHVVALLIQHARFGDRGNLYRLFVTSRVLRPAHRACGAAWLPRRSDASAARSPAQRRASATACGPATSAHGPPSWRSAMSHRARWARSSPATRFRVR